jgi:hypothetical protein
MRKRYLVQAILYSLLGADVALAQDEPTATAAPAEEQRADVDEQQPKVGQEPEAPASPQAAVPGAEQAKERHEKLKSMTPQDRREYLREQSEQRRKQAEAAMPSPPAPPMAPPFGAAPEAPAPTPEEVKERHEKLRAMSPEERRAQLREDSEKRRAEARAAMGEPPVPPAYEKLRDMTPEERRAYRDKRYQALRRQAAAEGLDLPEKPPWAPQPPGPGIRYMSDEERTAHWEAMSEMTPEERAVYRAEHHQRMMERAQPASGEQPEVPEWVKQRWERMEALQKKIDAMSAEDREACFAMQRLMQRRGVGRRWRGSMVPGADYPAGPGVRQGYAPGPAAPSFGPSGGTPDYPPPAAAPDYPPGANVPGYGYGPGSGWGRGYGYGPGSGYGQDYPPGPGYYGYGPQSGPRPGY